MSEQKNIALLYFSRSARLEGRRKNWASRRPELNRAIASSLILRSTRTVRASGLPVFHYHEGNQKGQTFGERMANAFQEVFALGFEAVISVGNDSPELARTNWQDITARLAEGECVIGPSLRGGAYLIGLTAAAFDPEALQLLPWQTEHLQGSLIRYCARRGAHPQVLTPLRDINTWSDLLALVRDPDLGRRLRHIVRQLLNSSRQQTIEYDHFSPFPPILRARTLRAPPCLRGQ